MRTEVTYVFNKKIAVNSSFPKTYYSLPGKDIYVSRTQHFCKFFAKNYIVSSFVREDKCVVRVQFLLFMQSTEYGNKWCYACSAGNKNAGFFILNSSKYIMKYYSAPAFVFPSWWVTLLWSS